MDYTQINAGEHLPTEAASGRTLWIGGAWEAAADKETLVSINPATSQTIAMLARGRAEDVDRAVGAAKAAAGAWGAMAGAQRAAILRRAAILIRDHRESLAILETIDCGKTITETRTGNVDGAAGMFEYFAGLTDRIRGTVVDMGPRCTGMIEREPYGVVGAISPWNYPLLNAATKVAPILACGNAMVLKPAEQTSLTALVLARLLDRAGLPKGVLNIVTGYGKEAGTALVAHPDVPKLSFTGSTATGRRIAADAGALLKSVTLELGGKSPLIVFDDADLDAAASGAVMTVMMNQGQTCTSCAKVLVARPLLEAFADKCKSRIAKIRIGDPFDPQTDLGPIVSEAQRAKIQRLIAENLGADAHKFIVPAEYHPIEEGSFLPPMIVIGVDRNSEFARAEIFGPVMTIYPFDKDEDAYEFANDTEYGLAASVWTTSLARAETARRSLNTGIVWINCVHTLAFDQPVPGRRASGLGSEYGQEAVDNYMRLKTSVTMFGGFRGPY